MDIKSVHAYEIPAPVVQAIVNVLNALPAGQVRVLLNDLEQICKLQDDAATEALMSKEFEKGMEAARAAESAKAKYERSHP